MGQTDPAGVPSLYQPRGCRGMAMVVVDHPMAGWPGLHASAGVVQMNYPSCLQVQGSRPGGRWLRQLGDLNSASPVESARRVTTRRHSECRSDCLRLDVAVRDPHLAWGWWEYRCET